MANYQEYQEKFAKSLQSTVKLPAGMAPITVPPQTVVPGLSNYSAGGVHGLNANQDLPPGGAESLAPPDLMAQLIGVLPYYGSTEWMSALRGSVVKTLASVVPNDAIAVESGGYHNDETDSFSYSGPYKGYRDAFFPGIVAGPTETALLLTIPTPLDPRLVQEMKAQSKSIVDYMQKLQDFLKLQVLAVADSVWWSSYSTAVLVDALRIKTGIAVNGNKLQADLSSYHDKLKPFLTQVCVIVLQTAYPQTSRLVQPVIAAGKGTVLATALAAAVTDQQLIANVNYAVAQGGDSTNAAVFFLFAVWVLLKALDGNFDVDGTIRTAMANGLTVPAEVQPEYWWKGGYTAYFAPLSGSDIAGIAKNLDAPLPEQKDIMIYIDTGMGRPVVSKNSQSVSVGSGYAVSFCNWSKYNSYRL